MQLSVYNLLIYSENNCRIITNMKKESRRFSAREIVLYVVFGVLAALVNYGCYVLLRRWNVAIMLSTALAWLISVVFAYYTNKYFVFGSPGSDLAVNTIAAAEFYGTRALTLLMEEGMIVALVRAFGVPDRVAKIITIVVTGIINYFISKLLVFRKRKTDTGSEFDA